MAYSFTDHYRPIRNLMRMNGVVVGFGLGVSLFGFPKLILTGLWQNVDGPIWPTRLAGAMLITLGILFLMASREPILRIAPLTTVSVSNSFLAIILLMAYMQQEFVGLTLWGQLCLIALFLFFLICAVLPLRYLRLAY